MVDKVADQNKTTTITIPRRFPPGEIVAFDVDEETYMRDYAESFYEWVEGVVIEMSPVSSKHDDLTRYLDRLLSAYLESTGKGILKAAPFVMKLETRREPDLQIILNENRAKLTETFTNGAADIAIEIVSPGSVTTDYGEKFKEYEAGGVREYWIIDPTRKTTTFYRLNGNGTYHAVALSADFHYTTTLLPKFKLYTPTLWQDELPDIITVVQSIQDMLKDD